jgi:signal transduction histidine kinase
LERVITNLLANALNYTPEGGVVVRTTTTTVDGEPWATVAVADTGLGIAQEDQARLFERFYRGNASRQAKAPGTGLGLAISQHIVALHGGRITFESTLGKGSTFTVWLPRLDRLPPNAPEP